MADQKKKEKKRKRSNIQPTTCSEISVVEVWLAVCASDSAVALWATVTVCGLYDKRCRCTSWFLDSCCNFSPLCMWENKNKRHYCHTEVQCICSHERALWMHHLIKLDGQYGRTDWSHDTDGPADLALPSVQVLRHKTLVASTPELLLSTFTAVVSSVHSLPRQQKQGTMGPEVWVLAGSDAVRASGESRHRAPSAHCPSHTTSHLISSDTMPIPQWVVLSAIFIDLAVERWSACGSFVRQHATRPIL